MNELEYRTLMYHLDEAEEIIKNHKEASLMLIAVLPGQRISTRYLGHHNQLINGILNEIRYEESPFLKLLSDSMDADIEASKGESDTLKGFKDLLDD